MAKVIVRVDGQEYVGRTDPETLAAGEAADAFFGELNKIGSLAVILNDGSHLLLNEAAIKRSVLIFRD